MRSYWFALTFRADHKDFRFTSFASRFGAELAAEKAKS